MRRTKQILGLTVGLVLGLHLAFTPSATAATFFPSQGVVTHTPITLNLGLNEEKVLDVTGSPFRWSTSW